MCNTIDFIHNYSGFHELKSSCHVRILNDEGKPLTVICSQLPSNTGTSVTNVAEHIASEICEKISKENKKLRQVIESYFKEYKSHEMIDHLINKLKESGNYSVFFLEILKQSLKFVSESNLAADRVKNLIWIEHYPPGVGFHPTEHEYAVVSFNKETWEPSWSNWVKEEAISEHTGYSVEEVTLAGVELN
ncbi:hypothetical protein [Aidingimonas lacisalsi]|uniref:hypothetical protein n=1 Tax=Aidingimonas lacisalsi TaxID=2604086 RepID=UPI0011D27E9C|nr:hypothetical protein [Aidingimonas lacisalsi]